MNRRTSLKSIAIATLVPPVIGEVLAKKPNKNNRNYNNPVYEAPLQNGDQSPFQSQWQLLPDMVWTGEEFWAQRLQDWEIVKGELQCHFFGKDRTLNILTRQISASPGTLLTSVEVRIPAITFPENKKNVSGFRLGIKGRYDDYRSAVMTGAGIDAGISTEGFLYFGNQRSTQTILHEHLQEGIRLECSTTASEKGNDCTLVAYGLSGNKPLITLHTSLTEKELSGNMALVCHFEPLSKEADHPPAGILFSDWKISGTKIRVKPSRVYGPVYFTQYTLTNNILKLSAQLAPVSVNNSKVFLEVNRMGHWEKVDATQIKAISRMAHFRIENRQWREDTPFRIKYILQLKSGNKKEFYYEGTIAREPEDQNKLKALVLSCNWDLGFPDQEVVDNASKHDADVILFLGDQFYEPNGGFGIQTSPAEKSYLDYLRKWYQFGWSYRELFRHKPVVCIPDDHDVFQGNLWGSGGKDTIHTGNKGDMQDSGGYFMTGDWVNLVMETQTSHMPDPYDNNPIQKGIHVFYTVWNYAGISFAIVEDRKWKSAPKNILPAKAKVWNGFVENKDFKITRYVPPESAELLGERQLEFLEEWAKDWSNNTQMKIWVSATPFMCLQTFPEGITDDSKNTSLPLPEPNVYLEGDHLAADMDSDGWPQNKRDKALKIIRKCFALQLTGDQHLPSVVHYGVDDFGDSGYTFAVPAACSVWPRRWWPPVKTNHVPIPGQPAYTGNFLDGFDNKITVHAVANPHKTGLSPSLLYDRSTGYGIVTFDKENRTIKMECWPRNIDPNKEPGKQYKGWPVTIKQLDNYGRKAAGYLPVIKVNTANPVVQVINEETNETEYTIRIKGNLFTPKSFSMARHTILVGDPDKNTWKEFKGIKPTIKMQGTLKVKLF